MLPPEGHCLFDTIHFVDATIIDNQWGDEVVSWQWTFEPTSISTEQNPYHVFSSAGVQPVTLQVESDKGCIDAYTTSVEVFARPEPTFVLSRYEGCEPLDVQYSSESSVNPPYTVSQWFWQLGNGASSNDENPFLQHNYNGLDGITPDTLQVQLAVASNEGCHSLDTALSTLVIFPKAVAGYNASPTKTDIIDPTIEFYDMSSESVTIRTWWFGEGLQSTAVNPVYTYSDTGLYEVRLNVETDYGCTDFIGGEIEINPYFSFYVPNTFTPNSDGRNDVFKGTGVGFTDVNMSIYNRWGQEIFYGKGLDVGWDGTFLGAPVEVAVYVYRIEVLDWKGEQHVFRGRIQLLR